jgi:Mrp family chromosome partitioning ATPase
MRGWKYILDEQGKATRCDDVIAWGQWFETAERVVKQEKIGASKISTVFLGLDHNMIGHGPPVLWETMVFGGELDQEQDRCAGNREQAEAMHERMVARVREHES